MVQQFGNLFPLEFVDPKLFGSHRKVMCRCECGRKKEVSIRRFVSGHTTTCGRCNEISAQEMSTRKWGKLKAVYPKDTKPGSNSPIEWECECGNRVMRSPNTVISGKTKTCGGCSKISKDQIITMKFGRLKIQEPQDVNPGSPKKISWVCDCGKVILAHIKSVVKGLRKSCSQCNVVSADEISTKVFGRLRIESPVNLTTGSTSKNRWVCACGNVTVAMAHHVLRGHTTSCGRCMEAVQKKYELYREDIRAARMPINMDEIKWDFIKPLEDIKSVSDPFRALCPVCNREYGPRWDAIRLGHGLTCGCTTGRISSGQRQILEFVKFLNQECITEFKLDHYYYDIYIPSKKLIIEFNGLFWHSMPESKKRDSQKYENAIKNGYQFISIMEDEWKTKRSVIESIIRNRVGLSTPKKLRVEESQIRKIDYSEAASFLASYHYLGSVRAKVYYGYYDGKQLIALMTISNPTRKSRYQYEITRMASHPNYRVYGLWSKLFKKFIDEYHPASVVSFSENRLFTGSVYERMGMKLTGEVPRDYWWCKGRKRYNKSGLRKPKGEMQTENELRTKQGYRKIWDLGKKRWVWECQAFITS